MLFCLLLLALASVSCGSLDCSSISPTASAKQNYDNIMYCLSTGEKKAALTSGSFVIPHGIALPHNSTLYGKEKPLTELVLHTDVSSNFMVSLGNDTLMYFITLTANNHLPGGCCTALISVGDVQNAFVHDCLAQSQTHPAASGVYFVGENANNNVFLRVEIQNTWYGVIFMGKLDKHHINTFKDGTIHDCHCDSCTLVGYGEFIGNTVYHNGWLCPGNPPIAGGGVYALTNTKGALIANNTVHDNCGMCLDNDRNDGFVVVGNHFHSPGYTWNGKFSYCEGATTVSLLDCSNYVFKDNYVENSRCTNEVGRAAYLDPNHVWEAPGAPLYNDVPGGYRGIMTFSLGQRPHSTNPTINNVIHNNQFVSDCKGGVGIGYLASRNTGWTLQGAWKPNLYTANTPFGSNVGSKRCGGNWYAGNSKCTKSSSPPPCNEDDYQHTDLPYRNDPGCGHF